MNIQSTFAVSLLILVTAPLALTCSGQVAAPAEVNLLKTGSFEKFQKANNPWAGVDGQNFLRVFSGNAMVVTNAGHTVDSPLPCSVNAVDINGDGILDLVVADAHGFTWYYPNQGTKTEASFSFGELLPMMLSSGGAQCLGMTAVDYEDNGKIGLVYGDWMGQIFYAPNMGTNKEPKFVQPRDSKDYRVDTSAKGKLWGNYFFPAVYDWDGDGRKDLIVGEGTYSANSIWLFLNQATNSNPVFNEKEGKRFPLIQGLGREHLTPVVIDWNGDGLPDIVTGERQGNVSVYINESVPNSKEYRFKPPVDIKFGSTANIGGLSRLSFADMNGDGLLDAIVGRANGRIGIAYNKGTATEPQFDAIKDVAGQNPLPPYAKSPEAGLGSPERSMFHLLKVVSNIPSEKDSFEEGYVPPPGSRGTHSLKLEFCDTKQKMFPNPVLLSESASDYTISAGGGFSLMAGKEYTLSFWVLNSGFRRMSWRVECGETLSDGKDEDGLEITRQENYSISREFTAGQNWTKVSDTFRINRSPKNKSEKPLACSLQLNFNGRGALYLDDFAVVENKGF